MNSVTIKDVEAMVLGATILGSGGGGDSKYNKLFLMRQLELLGSVPLISYNDLAEDDIILPVSAIGAPLVSKERLTNGCELKAIVDQAIRFFGKKPRALMPCKIGGESALIPLTAANELGLPVLDADLIGRTFSELQMSTAEILGISASPAILADVHGTYSAILSAKNGIALERLARKMVVSMGSYAAIVLYPMTGAQIQSGAAIFGSLSYAKAIGQVILDARAHKGDVIAELIKATKGTLVGCGEITDIDHVVYDGMLQGSVTISDENTTLKVFCKNEYLAVKKNDAVVASTTDIIVVLEQETGTPVTVESLQYGLKVDVVSLPAPAIWKTRKGLDLVGPRAFGYDFDYVMGV
jgi:uncharacterized protein